MINLASLPIVDMRRPGQKAIDNARIGKSAYRDGYAARRLGQAIAACPPFRDDAMTMAWGIGWLDRNDEEEAAANRG